MDDPVDGRSLDVTVEFDPLLGGDKPPPLRCATCGVELTGSDPEDEPDGDAGLPICGECNRARNFDVLTGEG